VGLMALYKKGDSVCVRSDLEFNKRYGSNIFVSEMKYMKGKRVKIERVTSWGEYVLCDDLSDCYWTNEMFASIITNEKSL
jgi:hypothetical protein